MTAHAESYWQHTVKRTYLWLKLKYNQCYDSTAAKSMKQKSKRSDGESLFSWSIPLPAGHVILIHTILLSHELSHCFFISDLHHMTLMDLTETLPCLQSLSHGLFDSHACLSYISSDRMHPLLWIVMLCAVILALFTGSASSGAAAGCVEASSPWGSLLTQDHDALRWRAWERKKKTHFLQEVWGFLWWPWLSDCRLQGWIPRLE